MLLSGNETVMRPVVAQKLVPWWVFDTTRELVGRSGS